MNILCLCTVRNRSEKTFNSIKKLKIALEHVNAIHHKIIVVDDASTDNTIHMLNTNFPDIEIILGNGYLYWAGGMIKGFKKSWSDEYSHVLVFNDDSDFNVEKLIDVFSLVETSGCNLNDSIMVGAFSDGEIHHVTYGVQIRKNRFLPYSFEVLPFSNSFQFGDTLNMNFALIPKPVIDKIGFLDETFTHSMADFDFGLRAKKAGFNIVQLPEYIGICPRNTKLNTWEDSSLTLHEKLKSLHNVKNFPPRERMHLLLRHAGLLMPIYFLYPYFKIIFNSIIFRRK
nr:glycosyl transferase [Vibrio fluvialis]